MAEQSVDNGVNPPSDVESPTITVTIRYFAAARSAAGMQEERLLMAIDHRPTDGLPHGVPDDAATNGTVDWGAESTVGQILDIAADRHGPGLARVLARCSFLLDEVAVHGRQTPVRDGQVLDILPPFAGG